MNWIYSTQRFQSAINGPITVRRILGRYTTTVNGQMESSPYTDAMWKLSMRRITKGARIKTVLMFGLAGGSCVKQILDKYPKAQITAIEWDPVMVAMYKTIHPEQLRSVNVLTGEALEIAATLAGTYDLIIFDLYKGNAISENINSAAFAGQITRLLAPNGYYLVNYWLGGKSSPDVAKNFTTQANWRFHANTFALYRPPLPPNYERYRAHPAFIERERKVNPRGYSVFKHNHTVGLRKKIWKLTIEQYLQTSEPVIEPVLGYRYAYWQPTRFVSKPHNWYSHPLHKGTHAYGLATITDSQHYWKDWSSHAQRHRKKWLEEQKEKWDIVEVTDEEFYAAFRKARLGLGIPSIMINVVKYKIRMHGTLLKLYGAKERTTGSIQAGLAVLHTPEASTSAHIAAFHLPHAKQSSVGVGLIDHWYKEAIAHNFAYLDFGVIRANGEPYSWQGFSGFKNQFLTHTVFIPKPLVRLTKGKQVPLAEKRKLRIMSKQ